MSRVRFHSMRALSGMKDVSVEMCGLNWYGWDENKTCQENINFLFPKEEFDLVVGFKPLDMKGFKDIRFKKCLRYNEMYDKNWTIKEIVQSGTDIVVCHHYNDYVEYKEMFDKVKGPREVKFEWVPHSAEKTIFKPMPEVKKEYDVALVGAVSVQTMLGNHYPLRHRMASLLNKMPSKYKCGIIPHVGGSHSDAYTDKYAVDFAKKINSAKIIITDSGAPKSRFGKYIEVPACGVALAGDVYNDHPDDVKELKEFLIEINMEMTDNDIINKLVFYLEKDKFRKEKIEKGLEYAKNYTHEKYAERFIHAIFSRE